jgi:hypothetical protein
MNIQSIRKMAKQFGIEGKGMDKSLLIKEIQRAEGNPVCFGTKPDYCDQVNCLWRPDCMAN